MKAVFWGYKFPDMKTNWKQQARWIAEALHSDGIEVVQHQSFICSLPYAVPYDNTRDNPCDVVIYNHADISHLMGNCIKARHTWFFKPTVPDEMHVTLDRLGFGPYSSLTYERPPFDAVSTDDLSLFFRQRVATWVADRTTKWGTFSVTDPVLPEDYYLVFGQCAGDETVTRHDFGNHLAKLEQVVRELARIDKRPIVVKLHPYMDGTDAKDDSFSLTFKDRLEKIAPLVTVFTGKVSVHDFLGHARCVLLANSGAGFEAMMHHKPIIAWGFPEYHWVTYDLRHLADLVRAIKLDWFNQTAQDKFLCWYMERYCFYDLPSAKKRVQELLQ